jgi:hypothetical protein
MYAMPNTNSAITAPIMYIIVLLAAVGAGGVISGTIVLGAVVEVVVLGAVIDVGAGAEVKVGGGGV